jgi:hypothetical protein
MVPAGIQTGINIYINGKELASFDLQCSRVHVTEMISIDERPEDRSSGSEWHLEVAFSFRNSV